MSERGGSLQGRVALVTGAGRGIGRAIALGLAAEGARVAATARSEDQLASLIDEIVQAGGTATALADDLSDRAAPARIVGRVVAEWGPVEILVNNAGIGSSSRPLPLVEFDDIAKRPGCSSSDSWPRVISSARGPTRRPT